MAKDKYDELLDDENKLSEEQIESLKKRKTAFFTSAESFRKPFEENWRDNYIRLRNYKDDLEDEDKWRSNLRVPMCASMVYSALPLMVGDYLNPSKPFFRIVPGNRKSMDDIDKADLTDKIIQYQIRQMCFPRTMTDTSMGNLCYGTGWQKVYWLKETKNLKRREPMLHLDMMGNPVKVGYQMKRKPIVTFDGPVIEDVDVFYMWPDPKSRNDATLNRYIHKQFWSADKLKPYMEQGTFKTYDLNKVGDFSDKDVYTNYKLSDVGLGTTNTGDGDEDSKVFQIEEYYENGNFSYWLNDEHFLRFEHEPFFHGGHNLIQFRFIPLPGEIFGISMIDLVKDLNDSADWVLNMKMDLLSLYLRRPFMVDVSKLEDPTQDVINLKPQALVRVVSGENLNSVIQPMPLGEPGGSPSASSQELHNYAQTITGITDYLRGQGSDSYSDTATGVSIITRQSMNRMLFHTQYISSIAIPMLIKKIIGLNNLYLSEEQIFTLTDGNTYSVSPDDIIEEYDVIAQFDPGQATKEQDRQQLLNCLQVMGGIPPLAQMLNMPELAKAILKQFDRIENPDALILPPAPPPPMGGGMPPPGMPPPPFSGQPPPQGFEMAPPPANIPPANNPMDMTRMNARGAIGNADKTFA